MIALDTLPADARQAVESLQAENARQAKVIRGGYRPLFAQADALRAVAAGAGVVGDVQTDGVISGRQIAGVHADALASRAANIDRRGHRVVSELEVEGAVRLHHHLAASGNPRGWVQAGELTPIRRYAQMFSGTGLTNVDGTAWYHPLRLTIDAGAVGDGNANPAQRVLDVHATHGNRVRIPIYAFGAALGDGRVLDVSGFAKSWGPGI